MLFFFFNVFEECLVYVQNWDAYGKSEENDKNVGMMGLM